MSLSLGLSNLVKKFYYTAASHVDGRALSALFHLYKMIRRTDFVMNEYDVLMVSRWQCKYNYR